MNRAQYDRSIKVLTGYGNKEAIYDKFLCNEDENSWPRNCVDNFGSNFHEIFRGIEMPKKILMILILMVCLW